MALLVSYIVTILFNDILNCFCFVRCCPCMAIIVINSVQYYGWLLPDIILLTQHYYHRGTRLNAMKRLVSLQPMIPPKNFDIISPP